MLNQQHDTATTTIPPYDQCAALACHHLPDCAHCDGPHQRDACECHQPREREQQEREQQEMQAQTEPRPLSSPLADILAARARTVEQERREAEELAQRQLEGQRADQLTAFTVRYAQIFPRDLRDALGATIAYDTTPEGYDEITDSGSDERGPFATFEYDTKDWIVRRDYYHGATRWTLEGPASYFTSLGYDEDNTFDRSEAEALLDALNAYPDWLERQTKRKQVEQKQAEERSKRAEQKRAGEDGEDGTRPLYACICGDDEERPAMLHTGSRVWIATATPDVADERSETKRSETKRSETKRLYYERVDRLRATVIAWDRVWLLVHLDDDETRQRLIPIARVVEVRTRA